MQSQVVANDSKDLSSTSKLRCKFEPFCVSATNCASEAQLMGTADCRMLYHPVAIVSFSHAFAGFCIYSGNEEIKLIWSKFVTILLSK